MLFREWEKRVLGGLRRNFPNLYIKDTLPSKIKIEIIDVRCQCEMCGKQIVCGLIAPVDPHPELPHCHRCGGKLLRLGVPPKTTPIVMCAPNNGVDEWREQK